ncbi:hypothetical protein ACMDCT_11655 [Halomonadaceae bacterium KBTZ08]
MKAIVHKGCDNCPGKLTARVDLCSFDREEAFSLKDIMAGTPVYLSCESCGNVREYVLSEINSRYRIYPESEDLELHLASVGNLEFEVEYWKSSQQYKIFVASVCDVERLLSSVDYDDISTKTLRQLLFVQIITTLEVYLSDRLREEVLKSEYYFLPMLLKADKSIGERKVTLSEVLTDPRLVHGYVLEYLSSIVYHNLSRVNYLYKGVFDTPLEFYDDAEKTHIYKAIEKRHDIVHRNGYNESGAEVSCTREYISRVLYAVVGIVSRLELSVNSAVEGAAERSCRPDWLDDEVPF